MQVGFKIHTSRTLFDEWNKRYTDTKDRIKELKKRRETATNPDDLDSIEGEMEELLIQANLIHQFLSDVGLMAFFDKKTTENRIS